MSENLPSDLEVWQSHEATRRVWKALCSFYKPYQALRTCEPEKVEYYRCQVDMMEDLARYFGATETSDD